MRKSFIIHNDSLSILDDLSDEQAGQLFKAIRAYQLGDEINMSPIIKIAFSPFKNQFVRDNEKYEKLCEKNKLIAQNRHKKNPTKSTSGNESSPSVTKSTDNDSKSDSKNKSDSDSKKLSTRFAPPLVNEVGMYFLERGSSNAHNEAEKFIDFYTSKNWMVGKNKMKDWKAAVRNWMRKDFDSNNQPNQQKSFIDTHSDKSWREGL